VGDDCDALIVLELIFDTGRGESTPRRMRVYANRPTIVDFADAEDLRPHLDIRLLQGEAGVTEYPLRTAGQPTT
jgi:hypothetical protein